MQYLLTEEEYTALVNAKRMAQKEVHDTLLELCNQVARHMPTRTGRIHGCVQWLNNPGPKAEYCSGCPVEKACPYDGKEYGK
jgi:hypothetical protein